MISLVVLLKEKVMVVMVGLRKSRAIFSLVTGTSIISLWVMLYLTGQIPEIKTEPFYVLLHISAELLLAVLLIVSGLLLLYKVIIAEKIHLMSMGMLVYSVINAAGYYGDKNEWIPVTLFMTLFIISVFFMMTSLSSK